jgi:pyrroloquinoline-quinone synthase
MSPQAVSTRLADAEQAQPSFLDRLRAETTRRYHDRHPFHLRMHEGRASLQELRIWAVNRYYYQTRIPIKDALILAKASDPEFRRSWIARITHQDGAGPGEGGLELWRRFSRSLGADADELSTHGSVLPGVRFACDAYVRLVERASLLEAVAASLTETLAPDLMERRIAAFERHYPTIPGEALAYFRTRVGAARADGDVSLAYVLEHARTRAEQDACVRAVVTKTEVLWHLLDCVAAECDAKRRLA